MLQAKEGFKKMVGLAREVPAWHRRLTEKFTGDVHMVGPTISCEGTPRNGDPAAEWRTLPHVQSHAIAVDQVAYSLITQPHGNPTLELSSPLHAASVGRKSTHQSICSRTSMGICCAGGSANAAEVWQRSEVPRQPLGREVVCRAGGLQGHPGGWPQYGLPHEAVSPPLLSKCRHLCNICSTQPYHLFHQSRMSKMTVNKCLKGVRVQVLTQF